MSNHYYYVADSYEERLMLYNLAKKLNLHSRISLDPIYIAIEFLDDGACVFNHKDQLIILYELQRYEEESELVCLSKEELKTVFLEVSLGLRKLW